MRVESVKVWRLHCMLPFVLMTYTLVTQRSRPFSDLDGTTWHWSSSTPAPLFGSLLPGNPSLSPLLEFFLCHNFPVLRRLFNSLLIPDLSWKPKTLNPTVKDGEHTSWPPTSDSCSSFHDRLLLSLTHSEGPSRLSISVTQNEYFGD